MFFTWSSSIDEQTAGWMAAVAYARATGGIVFDEQEGKLFTASEAADFAREVERDAPELKRFVEEYKRQLQIKT